jgi:hypothetical protein
MMQHVEMQDLLNSGLNILDTRIAKLNHPVTFSANQMVVLLVSVRFFVLCQVFTKLMLADQIAFH